MPPQTDYNDPIDNFEGDLIEEEAPREAAPPPSDIPPEIMEAATRALQTLTDAGFSIERSRKALLLNRFSILHVFSHLNEILIMHLFVIRMDTEAAINWLLEHMDDPTIDDPITPEIIQSMSTLTIPEEIVQCAESKLCTFFITSETMQPQQLFHCETWYLFFFLFSKKVATIFIHAIF